MLLWHFMKTIMSVSIKLIWGEENFPKVESTLIITIYPKCFNLAKLTTSRPLRLNHPNKCRQCTFLRTAGLLKLYNSILKSVFWQLFGEIYLFWRNIPVLEKYTCFGRHNLDWRCAHFTSTIFSSVTLTKGEIQSWTVPSIWESNQIHVMWTQPMTCINMSGFGNVNIQHVILTIGLPDWAEKQLQCCAQQFCSCLKPLNRHKSSA